MTEILSVSMIDYENQENIVFAATVLDIVYEGLETAKRPIKAILKIENSGETVTMVSWAYGIIDMLREASKDAMVYKFLGTAGKFRDGDQIRIGNMEKTDITSKRKIIRENNTNTTKSDIETIIKEYITDPEYKLILSKLVIENNDFFIWPAATKIHHAYPGGLAVHSLSVAKLGIETWKNYKGENMDIELIVTASLLHDIGKLEEYKENGERTIYGDLIPHVVSGMDDIERFCLKNNIDPTTKKITLLKHIILSHHGKAEYGSPVCPGILEAWVVHNADALDAKVETNQAALANLEVGSESERLLGLDGARTLKWK